MCKHVYKKKRKEKNHFLSNSLPLLLLCLKFFRLTFNYCPVIANTHTLLDQCSFELINICGMIQNEEDNSDWVQTLSSPAETDHTLVGRCRGTTYAQMHQQQILEIKAFCN